MFVSITAHIIFDANGEGVASEGVLRDITERKQAEDRIRQMNAELERRVVVSIFVNPTQFGPKEDFSRYPRDFKNDRRLCRDAGVDVIVFDVTNGLTYDQNVLTVCRIFTELRRQGLRTPQIAFLAHSHQDRVVAHLHENFFSKNLYPDLWFRWKGKPLVMASPAGLPSSVADFFTFRESWAWTDPKGWFGDGRDKWPWLDHSPQNFGWHETPQKPEQVAVAVAQHPTSNIE